MLSNKLLCFYFFETDKIINSIEITSMYSDEIQSNFGADVLGVLLAATIFDR